MDAGSKPDGALHPRQVQLGPGRSAGLQYLQLHPHCDWSVHHLPSPGQGAPHTPDADWMPHLRQQRRILWDARVLCQVACDLVSYHVRIIVIPAHSVPTSPHWPTCCAEFRQQIFILDNHLPFNADHNQ